MSNKTNRIGIWRKDEDGLPCFQYTGAVPYTANYPDGGNVKLPKDPWFLVGNYRITLFTHITGEYELITGEREWARLNQGKEPNSGYNSASLSMARKKKLQLTGVKGLAANPKVCKRTFGCGFAHYEYTLDGLELSRNLAVKPSTNPYNGSPAFLVTITIKNTSAKKISFSYQESVTANYVPMKKHRLVEKDWDISYKQSVEQNKKMGLVVVHTQAKAADPFLIPTDPEEMAQQDGYPPALFLKANKANVSVKKNGKYKDLVATFKLALAPKEEIRLEVIIGYSHEPEMKHILDVTNQFCTHETKPNKFANEWLNVLPRFPKEKEEMLQREMIWNAYNLEAMATYSAYYEETKIPQGTIYAYDLGIHASVRDNFQHAMPLPHYNPALAKSVLKYMMKRCTSQGRARLIEWGFGYSSSWYFYTSDQQLFSFMFLAEFFKTTKDYAFLKEEAAFFPYRKMPNASVLDYVEAEFRFLRDQVSTGDHGLVRLLNADWNDFVYHAVKEPYNNVLYTGESHMNSAMAIAILEDLIPVLKAAKRKSDLADIAPRLDRLIKSMELYYQKINTAFMKDLGNRKFPRRLYFNGKAYGEENMFLEPQGFTLQMKGLSKKRKKALYAEMKKRVYKGEQIGARQQEAPEFESEEYEKGSRENGGVWWALNGPVVLGVAKFDKPEAWGLLRKMTHDNFAKAFPDYWSSYWSQADNFESSLMPGEGLPDQTDNFGYQPVFCAHAHAWPLYCYYKLKE